MEYALKLKHWRPIFDFIALFAVIFLVLFLLLSATTIPNEIAAKSTQLVLKLISVPSTLTWYENLPLIQLSNLDVQINELCAGIIELSVLIALILATFEKPLKTRIKGAIIAVFFLLIFNAIRIAITITTFGTNWFDFLHELLFRALLIITIVIYYALWYYWPSKLTT